MEGYQYMWTRRWRKHDVTEEKLDCGLTTLDWIFVSKFQTLKWINIKIWSFLYCAHVRCSKKKFSISLFGLKTLGFFTLISQKLFNKDGPMIHNVISFKKLQSFTNEMNSWGRNLRRQFRDQIDDVSRQLDQIRHAVSKKIQPFDCSRRSLLETKSKYFLA